MIRHHIAFIITIHFYIIQTTCFFSTISLMSWIELPPNRLQIYKKVVIISLVWANYYDL